MLVQFRERGGAETRWSRIKAKPVREADGTRAARDQRDRGRHRAQAGRAGPALPRRGEPRARRLARLRGDARGDRQARGAGRGGLVRRRPRRRPTGDIQRVAVEHVDPAKVALAHELAERYPAERAQRPRHPPGAATGESQLWPRSPTALLVEAAQDEEHLRMIRELGMSSAMVVPMRVRDRVLGAISFVSAESGRTFSPGDLRLAEDLGAARRRGGRERAPVPRALDDRPDAAGVAAAADAARRARLRGRRALRRRRARTTRSAATSTTCSRPTRTTGSPSSATSAARAPRRRP